MLDDDGVDDLGERQYSPENTNDKGPDLTALFTITKANQLQVCSKQNVFYTSWPKFRHIRAPASSQGM